MNKITDTFEIGKDFKGAVPFGILATIIVAVHAAIVASVMLVDNITMLIVAGGSSTLIYIAPVSIFGLSEFERELFILPSFSTQKNIA